MPRHESRHRLVHVGQHVPHTEFFKSICIFGSHPKRSDLYLMQALDEKENERWKVAYIDPALISEAQHTFRLTQEIKEELEEVETQEERCYNKQTPHNSKARMSVYIAKRMKKMKKKTSLMCPNNFQ